MSKEDDFNDWLPMTASRKAKWYYSTVYNVAAMVGAGVLSLPHALSELGWGPGVTMLILSWVVTVYTFWQMIEMHEMVPGKRFDRYHELGQAAFGKKLGLYIVVPQQLLVMVSLCIVFTVISGDILEHFYHIACNNCRDINIRLWMVIFSSAHLVFSPLKSFHSIFSVILVAAIMSVSYSTIAWAVSANTEEVGNKAQYGYKSHSTGGTILNFFAAMGQMAYAYSGHNINLEIQATIPSTPEKPSKRPMWRGTVVAYIIIAFCYIPVALVGYRKFGNKVDENILKSLEHPSWLIALACMLAVVHFIGSYQLYAMAVFDMVESFLIRKLYFRPSRLLRFTVRYSFVTFTTLVAAGMPYFSALISFFGGLFFAPTTYFLPCIIWLILKRPARFSFSWWTNWVCIVLGVLLSIVGSIGGLKKLIEDVQKDPFLV